MKRLVASGTCVAAVFAAGIVALAQAPTPSPSQPQTPPAGSQPAAQSSSTDVTIAGCVQREADYRRAQNLGKGGAVGTGVGAGNEFVLVNASASSASATSPASPGTAGTAGAGRAMAYELTGTNEGDVEKFVGKRVEIVGKLKAAETGATGATGGPTAGAPPRGVDVASADLKLRELEVTSVREATGSCPPASSDKDK